MYKNKIWLQCFTAIFMPTISNSYYKNAVHVHKRLVSVLAMLTRYLI